MSKSIISRSVDEEFEGTFECERCGYEAPATVRARGAGAASTKQTDFAEERAAVDAEVEANAAASRTLWFVPCPRCGKTHPKCGMYRAQIVVGTIAIGLAMGLLAFLLVMKSRMYRLGTPVFALVPAVAIVQMFYFYRRYRRPWIDVASRVRFGAPTEPASGASNGDEIA